MAGQDEFPLTAGQLQHYRRTREDPSLRTAIWSAYRIPGVLVVDRFIDSVESLVVRHEALRTQIIELPEGRVRQRVVPLPDRTRLLTCEKVLSRSEEQFNRYVRHLVANENAKEWDTGAFPFRFRLLRYAPHVHAFIVGFSHLAVDGVGSEILMRDLMQTYLKATGGRLSLPCRPRQRFMESVLRQAAALERRTRRATGRTFSGVPPVTQFQVDGPGRREDSGLLSRKAGFSLAGDELAALRRLTGRHGCTEFHWILAAFAVTVFRFTRQDRLRITVPVNMRGATDRDVVGMYVIDVPVVIHRPADPDDVRRYPKEVGTALLRATALYQMGSPELLDESLAAQSERWGARCRNDLSITYRKLSRISRRSFAQVDWSAYQPQINHSCPGVGLRILSFGDALDVQAALNSEVFSDASANELVAALRKNLTSPGHWSRRRAQDQPAEAEAEAVALKDADGATVVSADVGKVEAALLRHPLVSTASVFCETGGSGETCLRAEVGVREAMTEDALRHYLLELGADTPEVLAPSRISVAPAASQG